MDIKCKFKKLYTHFRNNFIGTAADFPSFSLQSKTEPIFRWPTLDASSSHCACYALKKKQKARSCGCLISRAIRSLDTYAVRKKRQSWYEVSFLELLACILLWQPFSMTGFGFTSNRWIQQINHQRNFCRVWFICHMSGFIVIIVFSNLTVQGPPLK